MAQCTHTKEEQFEAFAGLCPLCLQKELEDIRLELSTPSTMGLEKEPLYKWAALIVCEGHLLRAEVEQLKEKIKQLEQDVKMAYGAFLK